MMKTKNRNWALPKTPKPITPETQRQMDENLAYLCASYPKPSIVHKPSELIYFMRLGYRFYSSGFDGYLQGNISGGVRIMMVDLPRKGGKTEPARPSDYYSAEFLGQYQFVVKIYSDNGKEVLRTNRYKLVNVGNEGVYTIWELVSC